MLIGEYILYGVFAFCFVAFHFLFIMSTWSAITTGMDEDIGMSIITGIITLLCWAVILIRLGI